MLSFNQKFLRGIEQKTNSWESWEKIQYWHSRHLETRKFSPSIKGEKFSDGKGATEKGGKKQILVEGVPEGFIRSSKLCIAFQRGQCDEDESHALPNGSVLSHSCAVCLKVNKKVEADHGARNCPDKKQLFR